MQIGNHHVSECWINALYDNYKQTLLRSDKKKKLITRETILEVLGRTETDIKDGLTIKEILLFFEKYKLKLRVYDVFYNLIHKKTTTRHRTSTTAPSTASQTGTTSTP